MFPQSKLSKRIFLLSAIPLVILFYVNLDQSSADLDATGGKHVGERSTQTRVSDRSKKIGRRDLRNEELWREIGNDFEKFKDKFPSLTANGLTLNRDTLDRSRHFQFWRKQLVSSNPKRIEMAARIFTLASAWDHLDPEAGLNKFELPMVQKVSVAMRSAKMSLDSERQQIAFKIEANILPPDVTAATLPDLIFPNDSVNKDNPSRNSDQAFIKDARFLLEHFVPKLKSGWPEDQKKALGVLNFFTYELYEEDGVDFWENALENIDNLDEFFEGPAE